LYEKALELSGHVAAYRGNTARCYHRLARAYLDLGEVERSANVLLKCERLTPEDPRDLCQVARELVQCMEALSQNGATLPTEDECRSGRFACSAVRSLRRAAARDRAEVIRALGEPIWAPLLCRPDFQQLRRELKQ
jgi:hypothetical protein